MAAFGRSAALLPPNYGHEPTAVVPLRFSFALDGAKVSAVALAPPSLDGLEFLRSEGSLSARNIIAVTSPLSPRAIGALRWPDVEAILTAALDLLPPDLVERMRGASGEGDHPAPPVDEGGNLVPQVEVIDDVAGQLGLNPADFAISV